MGQEYLNLLGHKQWLISKVDIKHTAEGLLEAYAVFDSGYPDFSALSVIVDAQQNVDGAETEAFGRVREFLNEISRLA